MIHSIAPWYDAHGAHLPDTYRLAVGGDVVHGCTSCMIEATSAEIDAGLNVADHTKAKATRTVTLNPDIQRDVNRA